MYGFEHNCSRVMVVARALQDRINSIYAADAGHAMIKELYDIPDEEQDVPQVTLILLPDHAAIDIDSTNVWCSEEEDCEPIMQCDSLLDQSSIAIIVDALLTIFTGVVVRYSPILNALHTDDDEELDS